MSESERERSLARCGRRREQVGAARKSKQMRMVRVGEREKQRGGESRSRSE